MRRNLVGKKPPQQPKIRWSDTVSLDAGSLTATQLKGIRDANSVLPRYDDVHWAEIADGSTKQFKAGDHFALSSAFLSERQGILTNISDTYTSQSAGTIQLERPGLQYLPGGGGNTIAQLNNCEANAGTITDVAGGGVRMVTASGSISRIGHELTGSISYGGFTNNLGSNEFFRVRVKISELTLTNNQVVIGFMNGSFKRALPEISEPGVYTLYCRYIGTSGRVALELGIAEDSAGVPSYGGCSMTIDYMHIDPKYFDGTSENSRDDNETVSASDPYVAVRANGATAYADLFDVWTGPVGGDARGTYLQAYALSSPISGRSADKRPSHEEAYATPAVVGNDVSLTGNGWAGSTVMSMSSVKDLWSELYSNNPAIGQDVDPTAEWFVGYRITGSPDSPYTATVQQDIGAGTYNEGDAWAKECAVRYQISVAAVSASAWDGDWKRSHKDYHWFARSSTSDTTTWDYEAYDSQDFNDEPNDFTLEARGIVLGAQQFFELCDEADGSQIGESGTTQAFRGERGKVVAGGNDFSVLAAGDEYHVSYGAGAGHRYSNVPASFEWRMVTFIGESGQESDIATATLDTESGYNHWSHAAGVFGFIN